MESAIFVVKRNGKREPYSEAKVRHAMQRIGFPESEWTEVLNHVESHLYDGISTDEVYKHVKDAIAPRHKEASVKLNLKQAIFELGPTGFPFEKYIQRIFDSQGFKTQTDLIMRGECVTHEVDVVLEKNGVKEFVEAKFHNQQGIKTDIHVVMYTYARFLDLAAKNKITGVWIVTNTKLSEDAIIYAQCKEMRAIAWNYPEKGNLQDFVENPKMYPVTILPLSPEEKQRLLEANIVLVSEFLEQSENILKDTFFIKPDRIKDAREHAVLICKG